MVTQPDCFLVSVDGFPKTASGTIDHASPTPGHRPTGIEFFGAFSGFESFIETIKVIKNANCIQSRLQTERIEFKSPLNLSERLSGLRHLAEVNRVPLMLFNQTRAQHQCPSVLLSRLGPTPLVFFHFSESKMSFRKIRLDGHRPTGGRLSLRQSF